MLKGNLKDPVHGEGLKDTHGAAARSPEPWMPWRGMQDREKSAAQERAQACQVEHDPTWKHSVLGGHSWKSGLKIVAGQVLGPGVWCEVKKPDEVGQWEGGEVKAGVLRISQAGGKRQVGPW